MIQLRGWLTYPHLFEVLQQPVCAAKDRSIYREETVLTLSQREIAFALSRREREVRGYADLEFNRLMGIFPWEWQRVGEGCLGVTTG